MDDADTLREVGTTVGYGLLGAVVTGASALGALYAAQPMQGVVYDLFYLQVGPSEASETAILVHFLVAGVVALGVALTAGDFASDRLANRATLARAVGALLGLVALFLVVALLELAAFLTAVLVLGAGLVGVPLALRYRYGVSSGAVPAFVGGVPVVLFLLLLAGVGIGWGWGYVMTAQAVPASAAPGDAPSFAEAPGVGQDLFEEGYCREESGRQTCSIELRGYEREVEAARFMARHGARCPYQGSGEDGGSFVARHEGDYYRVTCAPHGD